MNKQKLDSMWQIMGEKNFDLIEDINPEYLCTICQKLLIDACNAPCGCRYCRECITDYLKEESKICPGKFENCKDEVIHIDCDLHTDQAINTRISRLIVKCPNFPCQSKIEIKSIENHLEICEHRILGCPFTNIGCEKNKSAINKINEHLLTETYSHTRLLMEWINHSRNETNSLKIDMEQLRLENKDLKEKMESIENTIRDFERNKQENTLEIEKLGDEMCALKNENRHLKKQLENVQNTYNEQVPYSDLTTHFKNQGQEIEQLKRDCQKKEKRLENQEKKIEDLELKLAEMLQTSSTLETKFVDTDGSIENLRGIVDTLTYGELVWRIDTWSNIRSQARSGIKKYIHSCSFLTHRNGYKMYLEVWPDGYGDGEGSHLSIFCGIFYDPLHDILQFPFKYDLQISLMNQQTCLPHKTEMFKCSQHPNHGALIKELDTSGNRFGYSQFVELNEISQNIGLCQNDQIFIKCNVRPA